MRAYIGPPAMLPTGDFLPELPDVVGAGFVGSGPGEVRGRH